MPCRTRQDDSAHLYPAGEPDEALCGKQVSDGTATPGDLPVCVDCAKQLLIKVFRHPGRISSLEVVVRS
jgi:hypothetical protein